MKVGDQVIDGAKVVRRPNEDTSFAALLDECTIGLQRGFKNADRCGSNGPYFLSVLSDGIKRRRCNGRKCVALLVHYVIGWIIGLDRLEGSSADVKDDIGAPH